jgi:hypothetical protein
MAEWFALRVRDGHEGDAAIAIGKACGVEAYLPVELVRETRNRARVPTSKVRWRPAFPNHLFVSVDRSNLEKVRGVDGVDDVLRVSGKPAPIDADTIAALRSAERRGLFDAASGCRAGEEEPMDSRHAGLMSRVRSAKRSRQRTALLMSLLGPARHI